MPKRSKTARRSTAVATETRHLSMEIETRAIDEQSRTVDLSFSSEAEVERWFGMEVLDHSPRSVRLGRLQNGGALLMDHNVRDQIGVVESVTIEGGRGRAKVRFSRSARANEIFQDVVDGIRRLVSVGYRVHRTETTKRADGVELVRVTDWEPFEISLVSVPADDSVGVGRSEITPDERNHNAKDNMEREQIIAQLRARGISFDETAATEALRALLPQASESNQTPSAQRSAEETRPSVQVVSEQRSAAQPDFQSALVAERRRAAEIEQIAESVRANGGHIDHRAAIRDGVSVENFQRAAFESLVASRTSFQPGLADSFSRGERRDLERFDLGRAVRSLVNGRGLDGIEREIVDEGRQEAARAGIDGLNGITLPSFMVSRRDMTATGGTGGDQGGMTIQTNKAGLLDDFFNSSIMQSLGATVLTNLVGNLDVPRLIAGTAPAGKAENANADEVSPTTAQLQLRPKRLPAYIDVSEQLLAQSSSAIESMLRSHLNAQMGAVREAAFFHGTGTAMAEGIAATSGIGSVAGGTNGAAPTFAHMLALEEAVDATNALMGSVAYASNGQIRKKLKGTLENPSGTDATWILSKDGTINTYRAEFTNAISRTLTKGTASGVASAIFFGNFADYVVAYWGGLNLELVRDKANAIAGLYTLVASTYYDGGVQRPKSFAAMLDALGA